MSIEILLSMFTVLLVYWSFSSFRRHAELATAAAREICQQYGVQWLDGSVALVSLRLGQGLSWRFVYRYEYSPDGIERRAGTIGLRAGQVVEVSLPEASRV